MKRPKSGFKLGQMFGPGSKYFVFGSTKLFAVMHNYLKKRASSGSSEIICMK